MRSSYYRSHLTQVQLASMQNFMRDSEVVRLLVIDIIFFFSFRCREISRLSSSYLPIDNETPMFSTLCHESHILPKLT